MSWPLASFLIVGVVLALGWLAYERARPSARMLSCRYGSSIASKATEAMGALRNGSVAYANPTNPTK